MNCTNWALKALIWLQKPRNGSEGCAITSSTISPSPSAFANVLDRQTSTAMLLRAAMINCARVYAACLECRCCISVAASRFSSRHQTIHSQWVVSVRRKSSSRMRVTRILFLQVMSRHRKAQLQMLKQLHAPYLNRCWSASIGRRRQIRLVSKRRSASP